MSDNIDDVVIVTVTKQSATISRTGFGTTLWIGQIDSALQSERFKLYGSLQELVDAGFPLTHQAYKWADVHFSGDTQPAQFALGRRVPGDVSIWESQVTTAAAGSWVCDINGETFSYLAGAGDTEEDIVAGLAAQGALALLDGTISSAVTIEQKASPNDDTLVVTGLIGGEAHTVVVTEPGAGVCADTETQNETAAEAWTTAYAAINTAVTTSQWYFLNIEDRDDTTIDTAADTVQAAGKIGAFQTSSPDVLAGTTPNVISVLQALQYKRVLVFWKSRDTDLADAAMTGVAAAADLDAARGVITWNLKPLVGVPTDDLSTSQKTNISGSGGSYYIDFGSGGRTQTQSVEGEFMRVQTTIDWTKQRVKEDVFGPLQNTPTKIDIDTNGIGSTKNVVKGRLDIGVANGHFTGDFDPTVSAPAPEDIEENDKNAGILRNVKGVARLAQAMRQVYVQVDLTV